MSSGPRIGQTVHYRSFGTPGGEYQPKCRAAMVTEVFQHNDRGELASDPLVGLVVFNPTGIFLNTATFDASATHGGTWHYECVEHAR